MKLGSVIPPVLFFFLQIAFPVWGPLFHMNISIMFYISVKYAIGILTGFTLNLCMALGSMDILKILILLNHDHNMSFHLFVLSSVSFVKS